MRKCIKVYTDSLQEQIKDTTIRNNDEDSNGDNISEESFPNVTEDEISSLSKNQQLINLKFALSKADIKPYKDETFLAQIIVDSSEKKDIIDGIRKDLTQFIMHRTHYPQMKLEVIALNSERKEITATTPVERFRVLMETSPAINLLKNNFKCEIKY